MNEDEITFVYIMARDLDNYPVHPVKVGIARDPNARLRTIQTATPFKIRIFWAFRLWDRHSAKGVEQGFHRVLAARKSHGEWFDMHPHYALDLMRANLSAMHSSWPGMQDVDPVSLPDFLRLCGCPPHWVAGEESQILATAVVQ